MEEDTGHEITRNTPKYLLSRRRCQEGEGKMKFDDRRKKGKRATAQQINNAQPVSTFRNSPAFRPRLDILSVARVNESTGQTCA